MSCCVVTLYCWQCYAAIAPQCWLCCNRPRVTPIKSLLATTNHVRHALPRQPSTTQSASRKMTSPTRRDTIKELVGLATSEINIRCVAEAVSHPRHGNMDDWKWVLSHVQIEQPRHWNAYFVASRHIHELRTNQPVCGEVRLCGSAIVWATRREEFGASNHGPPWSTAELPGRVFGWPGAVVGRGGDRYSVVVVWVGLNC